MELNLKEMQNQLYDNLFVILNSQKIGYIELKKASFLPIIEKQFNILYFLETKNNTGNEQSAEIINRYNSLLNKNFVIDKTLKYSDIDNLVDDVNYLNVYYKNIMKIDLNEFSKKYKNDILKQINSSAKETINVENKEKISSEQQTILNGAEAAQQKNSANNANANAWANVGAGFAGAQNMGNIPGMSPYENPYLIGMAQARLSNEIKQGKVFQYKEKPKIIILTKMAAGFLVSLLAVACLILCIFMGMANGFSNSTFVMPDGTLGHFSSVTYCILYAVYFLLFLALALWLIYPIFSFFVLKNKGKKPVNMNELYHFAWLILVLFGVFFLVTLLSGLFMSGISGTIFDNIPNFVKELDKTTAIQRTGLWGWYYTYIVLFIISGLIIVPAIIGSVYNPKKDNEKIDIIMRQYIDELANGSKPF